MLKHCEKVTKCVWTYDSIVSHFRQKSKRIAKFKSSHKRKKQRVKMGKKQFERNRKRQRGK